MVSTKFEKTTTGYTGYFNLTIKATTKNVAIPFTFVQTANKGVFKGSFKVNRQDYGVGGDSMMLDNIATISILLNTKK
jgi:polyisoprenoid-binding protein YceI